MELIDDGEGVGDLTPTFDNKGSHGSIMPSILNLRKILMPSPALLYALKEEVKPILSTFTFGDIQRKKATQLREGVLSDQRWWFCQMGIGMANAHESVEWLLETAKPDYVLSLGYAGAAQAHLQPGDLILPHRIESETPTDHFNPDSTLRDKLKSVLEKSGLTFHEGILKTVWRPAQPEAKKKWGSEGTLAVDMETAAAIAICIKKRVPFVSLRVIFDGVDDEVPGEEPIPGEPTPAPATMLLKNPKMIWKIPSLMKKNKVAQERLAAVFNLLKDSK